MKLSRQVIALTVAAMAATSIGCASSAGAAGLQTNPLLRFGLTAAQRAHLRTLSVSAPKKNTYISEIVSVSCARHDDCEAVGATMGIRDSDGTVLQVTSFADHWNGTKWSEQSVVNPTGDTELLSVSCYAPNRCIAVGAYSQKVYSSGRVVPLTERWNGVRWTQLAIGAPKLKHSLTVLRSVSCEFDGDCTATGDFARGDLAATNGYAAQFDGSRWTRIAGPTSGAGGMVSCPATGDCFSISSYGSTVVRQQRGRWRVQKLQLPKHFSASHSTLNFSSLSCASVDDCVVVGSYEDMVKRGRHWTFTSIPIFEHYNGTGWHRMLLPHRLYNSNSEWARGVVSCSSPGSCVAGGFAMSDGSSATLMLTQGAWHIATLNRRPLSSISCPDRNYCVAMTDGDYWTANASATDPRIASIFNGKRWRLVRLPLPAFKIIA